MGETIQCQIFNVENLEMFGGETVESWKERLSEIV